MQVIFTPSVVSYSLTGRLCYAIVVTHDRSTSSFKHWLYRQSKYRTANFPIACPRIEKVSHDVNIELLCCTQCTHCSVLE